MNPPPKAAPMTKDETMLLIQLVAENTVITNKSTNAATNRSKDEAWQNLTMRFNSSVSSFPRTPTQIRLKWENLKKNARKRYANIKRSQNNNGNEYFPPDKILDKVTSVLSGTLDSFSADFSGDSNTLTNLTLGEVNDESEMHNVYSDEQSDSDGAGEREVIREIKFFETPKQENNFFSGASGSGTSAKRKHKMEEEKCKARIMRENALADYLMAKKRKLELENEVKDITIAKLKLELENAKLENLRLKQNF